MEERREEREKEMSDTGGRERKRQTNVYSRRLPKIKETESKKKQILMSAEFTSLNLKAEVDSNKFYQIYCNESLY